MSGPTISSHLTANVDDVILPNLDAAHQLARWLIRNEADAEDVVQEASLRALRYFRTFSGGDGRAWFLTIVRNMCRRWHKQTIQARTGLAAKEQHGAGVAADPETLLLNADTAVLLDQALTDMPARFRELLVLRELEGLSYQELADVMEIPLGTVMSRLFRARQAFRMELEAQLKRIDAQWSARTRKRDSHPSFDNPEGLAG